MKAIARVQTQDRTINQLQNNIIPVVKSLTDNPVLVGIILKEVDLVVGDNVIQHKLGRDLQGWYFVRVRGVSNIYDKQGSNNTPDKTLVLNSSAVVSNDIYVF